MGMLLGFMLSGVVAAPLRIAHRGAPAFTPENTLVSFQKALELGCDYLEIDVQRSADGVLLVMHDATVDRTTDGTGKVEELRWDEIRRMSAAGEPVPSLDEVLGLAVTHPQAKFILELKEGSNPVEAERALVAAVVHHGLEDRVVYKSFSVPMLARLRALAPRVPQIYVFVASFWGITVDTSLRFHDALKVPAEFVQAHRLVTGQGFIRRAHAVGKKVIIWGVEETEHMREWSALGADGIETDRLDLLNALR